MQPPHATIDFETASSAGYRWQVDKKKWAAPKGASASKRGLSVVGVAAYMEHPSTRILCLSYKLPGQVTRRWLPGWVPPRDLLAWIAGGGRVEAHNVMFERQAWEILLHRKLGWPNLIPENLQCSMATARVNSWPGKLSALGSVLRLKIMKDADGDRLLKKFSRPRQPTKGNPLVWIMPEDEPDEAERLYAYCDTDVESEAEASSRMPPMTDMERGFWLVDQEINWRGLGIDRKGVRDCIAIVEQSLARSDEEMSQITGFAASQIQKVIGWLVAHHVYTDSLDAEHLAALLAAPGLAPHPPGGLNPVRRVLELRAVSGSASVKKLFAMEHMASGDDRLRNLMVHHGARTGRPTGEGAQPLNMPRSGAKLLTCGACSKPFAKKHNVCPWCAVPVPPGRKASWTPIMIEPVLEIMASRSLDLVEFFFGDALLVIAGCLRGLFKAGPDHELIASDYSAIEAVVTAMLAGEDWRIEAFHAKVDIYLASASKITGTPVADYLAYYEEHGEHHPDRQMIGKVAELALGFGGWIGAWRNFDKTDNFNDYQVKDLIKDWRKASPMVVELWGGQWRGAPWQGTPERFGLEGCAVDAIQYPGTTFTPRLKRPDGSWGTVAGVSMRMREDGALVVTLPSTRELTYHEMRLSPSTREWASPGELSMEYSTWNTDPKKGPIGWIRMATYGAKLAENVIQAVAHDLLRFAILNLRAAGYDTVLHVYDEIVLEVALGFGSVEEVERIMSTVPPWAFGWPVRAAGGWRGVRYRKG